MIIDRIAMSGIAPSLSTAPTRPASTSEIAPDFSAALADVASNAVASVRAAESVSIMGVNGQASVQQTVEAVMSAEQTLSAAMTIRDKAVAAYLELSRTSI